MKTKLIILSLIFTIFATSCASRKVNKSEVKEEIKTEQTVKEEVKTDTKKETNTNVKEVTTVTTDKEKNVVKEVTEITPDDKTKPATVKLPNGQVIDITNAKYRNEKITDLSKEKNVSVKEYQLLQKHLELAKKQRNTAVQQNAELKRKLSDKQTEAKRPFSWWWLILVVGVGYLIYKKFLR